MNKLEDEIVKLSYTADMLQSIIDRLNKCSINLDSDPDLSLRLKSILYYQGCGDYNRTLFETIDLDKNITKKCQK